MRAVLFGILIFVISSATLWSCDRGGESEDAREAGRMDTQTDQRTPPEPGGQMAGRMAESCPMLVQGADLSVSNTDNGVAFTFTTEDGDVTELRARVERLARLYESNRGQMEMTWLHVGVPGEEEGRMNDYDRMDRERMDQSSRTPMPPASVAVTDVDKGARIELIPADEQQLSQLRDLARNHEQRMKNGFCWMPQDQTMVGSSR